jgi:TolA-binding protein
MRSLHSIAYTGLLFVSTLSSSACVTVAQYEELNGKVVELEKVVAQRDETLSGTIESAEGSMAELESRIKEAEGMLRANQANLGLQVQDIQSELAMVRGLSEDSRNEGAAQGQAMEELRGDLDQRLTHLETKLNEASNIPEGKTPLFNEAERQLRAKNYKQARRLYRTYLSRYPGDAKEPQVHFDIGLTLYSEQDYRSALGEFYWVVESAPESSVLNDALYYSGMAFAKVGQCGKAIAYFGFLTRDDSSAPARYKKQAKKQVEVLEKDSGKICTDRAEPEAKTKTPPGAA